MQNFRLSEANLSLKFLTSFFLVTVGIGYVFGLIHIYMDVGFSYTGVVTHYRGGGLPPELTFSRLIHLHHVHIFSLSMLFLLIGTIFVFTELPELVKVVFVSMPFVGMFLDFTSFWLLAFASPIFGFFAVA